MFALLQHPDTVLDGLHKAAALVQGAEHGKDSVKMAKVLSLLRGLQGKMDGPSTGHASHHTAHAQARPASGGIGGLADILTGKAPMP